MDGGTANVPRIDLFALVCINQWEREPEGGTSPWRALDAHVASEPLDNHAADMETQSQAHTGAAFDLYLWDAVKTLPDALLLLAG